MDYRQNPPTAEDINTHLLFTVLILHLEHRLLEPFGQCRWDNGPLYNPPIESSLETQCMPG